MKKEKLPRDLIIRAENMAKGTVYTSRNIIAGYNCTGKTEAEYRRPRYFIDYDHMPYKWHMNDDDVLYEVDNWQEEYVKDLLNLACKEITDREPWMYVLICTDPKVLKLLEERNIYYMAVVPDSIETLRSRNFSNNRRPSVYYNIKSAEYEDAINNYARHMEEIKASSALGIYSTDRFIFDIFT